MISGKQCIILWYVGDNKLSYMDKKVKDKIIKDLKKIVGF